MSGSKEIVLFGSFTEDETRSWLEKQSLAKAEKPVGKKELQCGTLGITFGSFGDESSKQSGFANGKGDFWPMDSPKKDKDVKIAKQAPDTPGVPGSPKDNGHIHAPSRSSSLGNGVEYLNTESISLSSLNLSQNEDGPTNQLQSSSFHILGNGSVRDDDMEKFNDGSAVHVKKEVVRKAANGPGADAKILLPRGLINSGNLCFLNATLQALLSCSPFVLLMQELRTKNIPKVGFPTITAFVEFVSEFDMPSGSSLKKETTAINTGRPFSPVMFEAVLKNFSPDVPNSISGRPRQEDAQEFLSFLMDQMHDELLKLEGESTGINSVKSSLVSLTEDDEWETVGPKNKSAVTRMQSFVPSELSDIFGGQLRSVVKAKGNRDSATVQPFLLLHLDICSDSVHAIEDALHVFSQPENLEGYRTSGAGKAGVVTAKKYVKIQTLSKVMILHLMRFGYGSQGSTKLHKPVHFPLELFLGRDLLVSPTTESRKYELVATITHHGREPTKGHYTADARCHNGQWLRFDDASVTPIGTNKVLHDQAYVLFYKQV